ncbi:hypothetical protein [Leptospirillum ferrooxidans]
MYWIVWKTPEDRRKAVESLTRGSGAVMLCPYPTEKVERVSDTL